MRAQALASPIAALTVFLVGLVLCMHHGRMGLHPLDSPIVFDGAWRLLSGQQFLTDFHTPAGFVPIGMQALFFKVFGVNWWAYRLHAGVMNGLFGCIVLWVLRMAGSRLPVATLLALLSVVVFYPPMGVPYLDQHSFFFLLLGVALTMQAARSGGRSLRWLAWVPATWVLAALSKQNPGLLAPLPCAVAWLAMGGGPRVGEAARGLLAGLVPAFLALWFAVGWPGRLLGPEGTAFLHDFWALPSEIGRERAAAWAFGPMKTVRSFAWKPFQVLLPEHDLPFKHLLYLPLAILPLRWALRRIRGLAPTSGAPVGLLLLGATLVVCSSFFIHSTQNQAENGLGLVFVAIGLGLESWRQWLGDWGGSQMARRVAAWVSCLLFGWVLGAAVWAGLRFEAKVNGTRRVLDFEAAEATRSLGPVRDGIEGLTYRAPYAAGELNPAPLVEWLGRQPGEVLYFGDMQFLCALAGKAVWTPSLWLHPGLTLPEVGSDEWQAYDRALRGRVRAFRPRHVVFEHPQRLSYMGLQWECLEATAAEVDSRVVARDTLGGFGIWTLGGMR